jgi:asparagine synthase (glutamine-hydrolysing)
MSEPITPLMLGNPSWPTGHRNWAEAIAALGPEQAAAQAQGAFAVGMALPDGRLFLAVDRFAVQTLCWRKGPEGLRFAERADQLGGRDIDPQALFDYLYFHVIPSPRTIFDGVHRLPAGHLALHDGAEVSVKPYWTPRFVVPQRVSYDELRTEFRSLLKDAVRRQLGAGTPACFLSGGTDSSTVAGQIREVAGRVVSYSIGFDAQGYDEMEYARIAARHFGAEHHEYYVTPDDLVRSIGDVAGSFDQPFGNSSVLPAHYCALKARADGVQKLLAGDGGDELFGGNSRYATQRLYGLYGQLPGALRAGLVEPLLSVPGAQHVSLLRKGRNYIRDAKVPLPDRLQHYNLLHRLGFADVLAPGFLGLVQTASPLQQQRAVWAAAQAEHEVDRMLAYDWRYTLAESDLPKVNGATRLAGLEVGYPLLDDSLLDFALRLPPSYKLRGFKLRWFFKEALRDFLPPEIIAKQKKGFGLPFGVWANQHAGLKALALDSLGAMGERGIVRCEFVRQLVEQHLPQHPGYYGEMVWILMMLEQWLRQHVPNYRVPA